ncbi:MAG: tetratricopeptide repeat protein [Lewinellaceae bacterium]|nr:tetratricopeptide repeat protein [Phaeodactylibacter sp.]MCB0612921.1 tetratricopeptide repeat protein [Phaeodactylibacter sp.]MCB9348267.1 tetratricopeptide repeat protein [Lewinellaceae bacterium]
MQKDIISYHLMTLHRQIKPLGQCGDLQEAVRAYEQCLASFPQAGRAGSADLPELLEELAQLHHARGDSAAALSALEQAISHYHRLGRPYQLRLAEALQQQGALHQTAGNKPAALGRYEESLSILRQRAPSEAALLTIQALKHMGCLHYEMQHFPEAIQCLEETLHLTEIYLPQQTAPVKLETAAVATLAAAIRMSLPTNTVTTTRSTTQFITLAEQYLDGLDGGDHLVDKRREELKYVKRVLEGLL